MTAASALLLGRYTRTVVHMLRDISAAHGEVDKAFKWYRYIREVYKSKFSTIEVRVV